MWHVMLVEVPRDSTHPCAASRRCKQMAEIKTMCDKIMNIMKEDRLCLASFVCMEYKNESYILTAFF